MFSVRYLDYKFPLIKSDGLSNSCKIYIRIYKLIEPDIFVSVLAFLKCFTLTENCFTFNPEICCFSTRFNVCLRHLYQSGFCCQNDLWFITSG